MWRRTACRSNGQRRSTNVDWHSQWNICNKTNAWHSQACRVLFDWQQCTRVTRNLLHFSVLFEICVGMSFTCKWKESCCGRRWGESRVRNNVWCASERQVIIFHRVHSSIEKINKTLDSRRCIDGLQKPLRIVAWDIGFEMCTQKMHARCLTRIPHTLWTILSLEIHILWSLHVDAHAYLAYIWINALLWINW